jgi:CDGSH-type Zn-finger protein
MALIIKGRDNGPYMIDGVPTYADAHGNEHMTSGRKVHLRRCGGSSNKSFCEGTHRKIGFQAPGAELTLVGE